MYGMALTKCLDMLTGNILIIFECFTVVSRRICSVQRKSDRTLHKEMGRINKKKGKVKFSLLVCL